MRQNLKHDPPLADIRSEHISKRLVEFAEEQPLLDKAHSAEDIVKALNGYDLIASIKCDGLSVRIIYQDGEIVSANTRGDGYVGQDITEHIKYFTNVPLHINKKDTYIIDGEAIIYDDDFEYINRNDEYANSRNLAAGSLSLLDMSIVKDRRLSFIAWDVIKGEIAKEIHYNFEEAEDLGFTVVPAQILDCTKIEKEEIDQVNKYLMETAKIKGIPCDGIVWKINDITMGAAKGQTAKFFNNAIAWKPEQEEHKTYLKDIHYDVSRNGILTPVAVFEPIKIDGSVVEKASLHNMSIMEEVLGATPYYGEPVWVYKANLIIPQISRAEKLSYGDIVAGCGVTVGLGGDYGILCPICGSTTSIITSNTGVKVLYCENEDCPGKLAQRLDHFLGKKGLDVHGISLATLHKLIDWGWINELRDIFKLEQHKIEWISKEGFGETSVGKILSNINSTRKEVTLVNYISALGIPLVGKTVAKEITKYYSTWEEFRAAVHGNWTVFDGFGSEMNDAINNFDYTEADYIAENYITFAAPQSNEVLTQISAIKDKKFCATGKLKNYSRDSLKVDIESYGGRMVNSVTSATDYLITNTPDSGTQKNRDAQKLGVKIITEEQYENLKK